MQNNKSVLFAALVGIGFAASAHADVTIYGTLLPFVDTYRTTGATQGAPVGGATQVKSAAYTGTDLKSVQRMSANTSNLGFKGSEDLGDGLKAIWQIESQVNVDGDAGPPNSTLGSRNTRVGLASERWGTLFFGNWDTPYKAAQIPVNPFVAVNPFDDYLIGNPGFGVPGTTTQSGRTGKGPDASFSRRQGNSVQYWSPTVAGFSARADVSFGEARTSATPSSAGINPMLWSASVNYADGPLSVSYAYEQHRDYFGLSQLGGGAAATPANSGSKDEGHMLIGRYRFASATQLGLIAEQLRYHNDDTTAGAVTDFKRNAVYALVQQYFGPHQLWASFGKASAGSCRANGGGCSTNGLGATQWSVGGAYALSKRTQTYAAYYGINNQQSASYAIAGAPAGAATPGADSRGLGVGILHSF